MFASRARELACYGGAGAGKSYAVAQKLIMKALMYPGSRVVVIRKYGPSLKLTCFKLVCDLLARYGIPHKVNLTELKVAVGESVFHFLPIVNSSGDSSDAADRIKSLTDITDVWVEEATEISPEEYQQIKLRLRGEELKAGYRQIILTFNPIDKNHWIYRHFFEGNRGDRQKYTYHDNCFIDSDYKAELEGLAAIDLVMYQIYALGEWGTFGHLIYSRYAVEEFEHPLDWYDEILAGVDFGFEHPAAWVFIGLKEQGAYLIDEIYERKLTNPDLVELITAKQSEWRALPATFADSAEPGRIEEMGRAGLNVYPAMKAVADGISMVKSYQLHIHPRCVDTLREIRGYSRKKDRNGNVLDEPVKSNDHAMDALRYALYTYRRMIAAQAGQATVIYDDPVVISPC